MADTEPTRQPSTSAEKSSEGISERGDTIFIRSDAQEGEAHSESTKTLFQASTHVSPPNKQTNADKDYSKGGRDKRTTADPESSQLEAEGQDSTQYRNEKPSLISKYRLFVHIFVFLLFTGWWIAGLILHRNDFGWVVPFLLWLAITLRLLTFNVPSITRWVYRAIQGVWRHTGTRFASFVPRRFGIPLAALLVVAVFCIGAFASPESMDNTRQNRGVSLFGQVVCIAGLWATSRNRKMIQWHTVIVGILFQFIIALFVLRTGVGFDIFNFVSELAQDLLGYAKDGVITLTDQDVPNLPWFIISVLPAIIFFVSFIQILNYWGWLQWIIRKFAVFFFWAMRVSGAEAVVASASPFVGQGESAVIVKPFVAYLTRAELHTVMCTGFATISGSILVAFIGLGLNARALISSCVMSIPASLAISKLRYPEEENAQVLTMGRVVIPQDPNEQPSTNVLQAFAKGAWLGLKMAGMITANLLCILALVGLIDGLLTWWGQYLNIIDPPLTIELVLGYICYPIAFLLGVPRQDLLLVGRLIGMKVIENEFIAFNALQQDTATYGSLSPRSRLIATYALCGFGNIGSLGIQVGVLTQIAPTRGGDISRIAFSALISGCISTLSSASIAGLLVTDESAYIS